MLRFVDEMSAREIGEVMGRSEGAVRVLIHRALRCRAPSAWRPRTRRESAAGTRAEDALQLDAYLDSLLAGHEPAGRRWPSSSHAGDSLDAC